MHANNKQPFNEQDQRHGYWEVYWDNGRVHYKGYFINEVRLGLSEWQHMSGSGEFHKQYYAH